ncbi:hypothetical protein MBLNU459_g6387t2 [Dothideomycetes sp. NU459]
MYSIQFLQSPAIVAHDDPPRDFISAAVSIVSAPSEALLEEDVPVVASLLSDNDGDTPCFVETYSWKAGMSSLRIVFDITNMNVIWPARIKVRLENQDMTSISDMLISANRRHDQNPRVQTVQSDLIDPGEESPGTPRVERQFALSSERVLTIWEGLDRGTAGQRLRPAGVALLAYLDSIIATTNDASVAIAELDDKLQLAASKKLNIVNIGDNCGVIGIGIAQLLPDCHVVMVDGPQAEALIEANIKGMFPAVLSSARYESFQSDGLALFDSLTSLSAHDLGIALNASSGAIDFSIFAP